jgi:5-formyltetrahydrofolate cyclo-ligase
MAVPKLAEDPPFYEFNPGSLPVQVAEAASRERAAKVARRVGPGQMRPVDMAVCGSVAVNRGTGKNHAMT